MYLYHCDGDGEAERVVVVLPRKREPNKRSLRDLRKRRGKNIERRPEKTWFGVDIGVG